MLWWLPLALHAEYTDHRHHKVDSLENILKTKHLKGEELSNIYRELMSGYQAQQFLEEELPRGAGTAAVLRLVGEQIPVLEEDQYLYPHLETLRALIHSGALTHAAEAAVGELKLSTNL